MATLDTVVIKITGDTKGLKKTTDALVEQGKVEKENVKIFEQAAKKRKFLLDRGIERLRKLEIQRKKAFNPKDIRRFDERIKETTKDIGLLGGKVDNLGKKSSKLGSSFGKLGAIVVGAFAVGAIVKFTKHLFEVAVESEAFRKRAQVVFGDSSEVVEKFARKSPISLGFTEDAFLGATAAIGDILVPLGLSRERAAEMSIEAVKLGSVLKEFTGDQRSAAEISNIVAKAFTGEVESLKGLGIVVNQNDEVFRNLIKTKIRDLGLTKAQAKAEAIFETILLSSADALKSFDTNADSLTRQQAELNAQLEELTETLSLGLAPAFLTVTKAFNDFLKLSAIASKTLAEIRLGVLLESLGESAKADIEEFEGFTKALRATGKETRTLAELSEAFLKIDQERLEILKEDSEANKDQILILRNRISAIKGFVNISDKEAGAAKERIRNVFFLKDAISVLTKEQQAQGTSLQRVAQIQKEVIPLQKELNDLLGKGSVGPFAQLTKQISNLKKELRDQSIEGNISKDTIKALDDAVDELVTAEVDLQIALSGTLPFIDAQKLALEDVGKQTKTDIDLIREFGEIQKEEAEKIQKDIEDTANKRLSAIDMVSQAETQAFNIIAQLNFNKLITIDNEEAKQLKALEATGLGEEELAKRRLAIQEKSDADRAIILTKQAKADKVAALFQAAINTAVAITKVIPNPILIAIAAALGAIEIAAIAAQPIPTFHEGKKSELKEGEMFAKILKTESVIPPKQSKKYKGAIDSMIDKKFESYVFQEYMLPMMKQMGKTQSSNPYDDIHIWNNQKKQIKLTAETNTLIRTMTKVLDPGHHRRSWR